MVAFILSHTVFQKLNQRIRQMTKPIIIEYEQGSLIISGYDPNRHHIKTIQFDQRTLQYRAAACMYRDLLVHLSQHHIDFLDKARSYKKLVIDLKKEIIPRPHQKEALDAWDNNKKQGVVSLPTGSGKTILAILAIIQLKRSTLIVVPTIDLLNQWYDVLIHYLFCI